MATFQNAIKWMREGKKVRRENWAIDSYIYVRDTYDSNSKILHSGGNHAMVGLKWSEAKDWECIEDNLSNKIGTGWYNQHLRQRDIKNSIRKIKEGIRSCVIELDEIELYFPKGDKRRGEVLAILGVFTLNLDKMINKEVGKRLW